MPIFMNPKLSRQFLSTSVISNASQYVSRLPLWWWSLRGSRSQWTTAQVTSNDGDIKYLNEEDNFEEFSVQSVSLRNGFPPQINCPPVISTKDSSLVLVAPIHQKESVLRPPPLPLPQPCRKWVHPWDSTIDSWGDTSRTTVRPEPSCDSRDNASLTVSLLSTFKYLLTKRASWAIDMLSRTFETTLTLLSGARTTPFKPLSICKGLRRPTPLGYDAGSSDMNPLVAPVPHYSATHVTKLVTCLSTVPQIRLVSVAVRLVTVPSHVNNTSKSTSPQLYGRSPTYLVTVLKKYTE